MDNMPTSRKSGRHSSGSNRAKFYAKKKTYASCGTAGKQRPDGELFAVFLGEFAFAELICGVEPGTLNKYDTRL